MYTIYLFDDDDDEMEGGGWLSYLSVTSDDHDISRYANYTQQINSSIIWYICMIKIDMYVFRI